jgi:hypothetical protein
MDKVRLGVKKSADITLFTFKFSKAMDYCCGLLPHPIIKANKKNLVIANCR